MASSERRYDFGAAKREVAARRNARFVRDCLDDLGLRYDSNGIYTFLEPGHLARSHASFCVFANGSFKDFSAQGSGEQGDLVALASLAHGWTPMESLQWLYGRLGWAPAAAGKRLSDAELLARDAEARARREADEALQARADDEDAKYFFKRYNALPYAAETVVQTYYEVTRGVVFGPDGLDHLSHSLRFQADAIFRYPDGGEELLPTQVAPFFKKGRVCGLHRTFLAHDGRSKAKVGLDARGKPLPVKKMLGKKGIIPLHKGVGGYSAAEALRRGHKSPLILAEGNEDAIVGAYYKPKYRAWAAGDKDNLAKIAWPDIANVLIVMLDNDGDTAEVQEKNAAKVKAHFEAQAAGRPLVFFRAGDGAKDISDWHNL